MRTAVRRAGCGCGPLEPDPRAATDAGGARWLDFDELLRHADVLVVVVALAPETRSLIAADQLALLPPGAFVINAARGGIVDEGALLAAIRSGVLAGGALDVYATEPLPATHHFGMRAGCCSHRTPVARRGRLRAG